MRGIYRTRRGLFVAAVANADAVARPLATAEDMEDSRITEESGAERRPMSSESGPPGVAAWSVPKPWGDLGSQKKGCSPQSLRVANSPQQRCQIPSPKCCDVDLLHNQCLEESGIFGDRER